MKHTTKKINIKGVKAEVDINVIPLVLWLNKFKSITTFYSCEGNGHGGLDYPHKDCPHVIFTCNSKRDIKNICLLLENFKQYVFLNNVISKREIKTSYRILGDIIKIEVMLFNSFKDFGYNIIFANKNTLNKFLKYCSKVMILKNKK